MTSKKPDPNLCDHDWTVGVQIEAGFRCPKCGHPFDPLLDADEVY